MTYCIVRKDLLDGETRGIYPVDQKGLISREDFERKAKGLNKSAENDVTYVVCLGSFDEVKQVWESSRGPIG